MRFDVRSCKAGVIARSCCDADSSTQSDRLRRVSGAQPSRDDAELRKRRNCGTAAMFDRMGAMPRNRKPGRMEMPAKTSAATKVQPTSPYLTIKDAAAAIALYRK